MYVVFRKLEIAIDCINLSFCPTNKSIAELLPTEDNKSYPDNARKSIPTLSKFKEPK